MNCPECGNEGMSQWSSDYDLPDSYHQVFKTIWECQKCNKYFEILWEAKSITKLEVKRKVKK